MKASNIYQKLKSAGVGNPDGIASKKPVIKGVGVKSPLNMIDDPFMQKEASQKIKDNEQRKANEKARKEGRAVSYKDAYADADKKKYKTYEEFEKAAKDYNKKKYDTENPTSEAKKQNITKEKLAENVKKKKETPPADPPKTEDPKTEDTPKTNVAKDARKEVAASNKAKRQERRAKRRQKRADRIKETGGTRVGNLLRKGKAKVQKLVEKKDKSPAEMNKKSAMKMGKKSPMKMAKKSPNKLNKGFDKLPKGVQDKILKKKGSPAKIKGLKKVAKKATDMAIDMYGGAVAKAFGKGDKVQSLKNKKNRALGLGVNYKEAYADADKKKYPTYESFKKDAVAYNKKKSPNKLYKKKK